MVYKRMEDDIVLARFVIRGDTIRFIQRKNKFYRIDDDFITGSSQISEITREIILSKTRKAFEATLTGNDGGEIYEIWINDRIHKLLE